MTRASSNDLDYLATRLHARRSRMAEAGRLDELCHLRSLPELSRAIFPGAEFSTAADFQRRLAQQLAAEISGCLKHLDDDEQNFIAWLLVRLQVENAKILLRGLLNHVAPENLRAHLVPLPESLVLDSALMTAKSLEQFAGLLPAGTPRNRLRALLASQREPPPFLLEAALDAGYFQEFWTRTNRLPGGELETIKPLIAQEIHWFEFMLVARGRFHFGLTAEMLSPLRATESAAGSDWFVHLLSAPDIPSAAKSAVGIVIDALPAAGRTGPGQPAMEISAVESLAWQRYLRLANAAFRQSHLGVGAVAGYFGVRRMEIANLITLSESIRLGVGERETRARLLPRTNGEAAHV